MKYGASTANVRPPTTTLDDMVLAITTSLDHRGSILERIGVHKRQRHAFGADFLDERGDIFCKSRPAPDGIEVTHLRMERQRSVS